MSNLSKRCRSVQALGVLMGTIRSINVLIIVLNPTQTKSSTKTKESMKLAEALLFLLMCYMFRYSFNKILKVL